MPGGCWHSSGLAVPIRCHIASHKVPRCRPHGSPVAGHRPSSRYVYSSWTPCLRTPLATGSCGIAKQGATAATCGTPGLFRPSLSANACVAERPQAAGVLPARSQSPHKYAGGVRLGVHSSSNLRVATRAGAAGRASRQATRSLQQQARSRCESGGGRSASRAPGSTLTF